MTERCDNPSTVDDDASDRSGWRLNEALARIARATRVSLAYGVDVTPVNPHCAAQVLHGHSVVATLGDAAPLEMVDVFRDSNHVGALVDDPIRLGAKSIWRQRGALAGITAPMDRCPVFEDRWLHLFGH